MIKTCKICGTKFNTLLRSGRAVTCSPKCSKRNAARLSAKHNYTSGISGRFFAKYFT